VPGFCKTGKTIPLFQDFETSKGDGILKKKKVI
jgi:hypothetical protein